MSIRLKLSFTLQLFLTLTLFSLFTFHVNRLNAEDIVKKAFPSHKRSGLGNIFDKFQKGGEYSIGYFGASITNGAGASSDSTKWRWLVHRWFESQYPQSKFKHVHVVNGGTGSDLGACRLRREILEHNPSLVFVEFAVNDGGKEQEYIFRTAEGIVRQIWNDNPETEIIFFYTLAQNWLDTYAEGNLPRAASAFEVVAEHYNVPSIDAAYVSAQALREKKLTWDEFSIDSVHPKDAGYRIYADHIIACIKEWRNNYTVEPHSLPAPLREDNWEIAGMVPAQSALRSPNWKTDTDDQWKRYTHFPNLQFSDKPGESLKFRFKGTHFGIYDIMATDSGTLDVFVDGKLTKSVPRWDKYSLRFNRSSFAMLGKDLENKIHEVELRVSEKKEEQSKGHAIRIGFIIMRGEMMP